MSEANKELARRWFEHKVYEELKEEPSKTNALPA
jgi:hypothetical protein